MTLNPVRVLGPKGSRSFVHDGDSLQGTLATPVRLASLGLYILQP